MMNNDSNFSLRYLLFIISLSFGSLNAVSQINSASNDSTSLTAEFSDLKNDSLLTELKFYLDSMNKPKSFFSVYASFSNSLFSTKNNAFNSQQSNTGITAFMPSISYYNKTGFGLSATSYIRSINNKFSLYQTALTPSFDKINRKLMFGVSYSYYVKREIESVTPYEHEIYAYIQSRKTWLRPSLAMGFATGEYQDISSIPVKINGNYRWITDTSSVHLQDISLSAGVSHTFSFDDILMKNDLITIVPQLSLIGGMQIFNTVSNRPFPEFKLRGVLDDRIRKVYKLSSTTTSSKASIQTLAFSTNLSYMKNNISISMGYFMGYYFNNTTGNKFSHIFNLGLGLTF